MKALIVAAILLSPAFGYAQNWEESTLFLNNGDSLKGQVDFRDWKISPSSIRFRDDGRIVSYDGDELQAFIVHVKSQRYQLVQARLRYYSTAPVPEGTTPIVNERPVAVYAEVVYSSPAVTLCSLQDPEEDERLFVITNGKPTELIHFTSYVDRNGRTFVKEDNTYRQQLTTLLSGCEIKRPSGLVYTSGNIIPLVRKYSECKGFASTVEKKEVKGLVNLGVNVGQAGFKLFKTDFEGIAYFVCLDFQVLSKRRLNKNFVWMEAGLMPSLKVTDLSPYVTNAVFGLYGGTYFGKKRVQPLVFTGLSSTNRAFDTGFGVALDKRVVLTGGMGLLTLAGSRAQGILYSFKLKIYPRFKAKT